MDYSNLMPVKVPDSTTLAELQELAKFRGWPGYRYDARRGVLYAITKTETRPLLNAETLMGDRPLSMFHRRQAT